MKKTWQDLYEKGKASFEHRRYDEAQRCLEELTKGKTNFADVYNMLGFIYHFNGKLDEAIKFFEKAVGINPRYTEAALNLAVAYNETGEFEKANEVYGSAKSAARESQVSYLDSYVKAKLANMHSEIGAIYQEMGFYMEAVDEYKKALLLKPEFVDIKTRLGITYRDTGDFKSAIREFEEVLRIKPGYAPARLNKGVTYFSMGDLENARKEWNRILKQNPGDRKAGMYLNLLNRTKGKK
ncbi:MAG: hypothetical protein A2073_07640 [Deltaproteobacteria bacterium GWC2_42_11]|nr:MAG: hypothetical protein A2073_07640 [Deltaproteobacteria bacterium GWC2_42_11]HBO84428.1 hypothetical protein [Deltaproteobacteria bacterium]